MKKFILFAPLLWLAACTNQTDSINKFSDPLLRTIYTLQDQRSTDSLLLFLSHKNSIYRKDAALAFASVQDTAAAEALRHSLLHDSDNEVRSSAAFALGQTPCLVSSDALTKSLSQEKDELVLREVLEALGKVLPTQQLATLTAYQPKNTNTEAGKAWGIYRLGLRRITDSVVVKAAYQNLGSTNEETLLAATHFFARATLADFKDDQGLLQATSSHSNVFVRMAGTQGLRNVKTDSARLLLQLKANDKDERVRVSAVRALRSFAFADVKEPLFKALGDNSLQVRVAVAESLNNFATKDAAPQIKVIADTASDWRVQSTLYEVVAALDPQPATFESIKRKYEQANNSYHKAALLNVLGRSANNVSFVGEELIDSSDPIVLSSAAQSLTSCNNATDFKEKDKPVLLQWYQQAIAKGDAAVTGIIAQVLGDSTKNYKPLIKDVNFLKEARAKLSLPKDNESIQPLEAALAYLEGRKAEEVKNEFNHPIDWNLVNTIPENQIVLIKTTKGDITLKLLVDEAPGSVANFVMLAKQQYFDGKLFHREVPNFVIQAGCNRGDGYGSEPYSIRSEFTTRRYKEGSVGMASAGKDTEGTQWFITHSPTPHLDGRYTIFAEVTIGMDVVNTIEVGDKIIEVSLQ